MRSFFVLLLLLVSACSVNRPGYTTRHGIYVWDPNGYSNRADIEFMTAAIISDYGGGAKAFDGLKVTFWSVKNFRADTPDQGEVDAIGIYRIGKHEIEIARRPTLYACPRNNALPHELIHAIEHWEAGFPAGGLGHKNPAYWGDGGMRDRVERVVNLALCGWPAR